MIQRTHVALLAAAAAGCIALSAVLIGTTVAQEAPVAGDTAAEVFGKRCATCHTVPDPALATDKAWLEQVAKTA